jgi:hypothetical protein
MLINYSANIAVYMRENGYLNLFSANNQLLRATVFLVALFLFLVRVPDPPG